MPESDTTVGESARLRKLGLRIKGRSYSDRNRMLLEMGFASYAAYLRSQLWASIRRRVYEIKGGWCYLCGRQATELHHNRYHLADLEGRRLRYISPICRGCHHGIEFDGHRKLGVREASKRFRMRRSAGRSAKPP